MVAYDISECTMSQPVMFFVEMEGTMRGIPEVGRMPMPSLWSWFLLTTPCARGRLFDRVGLCGWRGEILSLDFHWGENKRSRRNRSLL